MHRHSWGVGSVLSRHMYNYVYKIPLQKKQRAIANLQENFFVILFVCECWLGYMCNQQFNRPQRGARWLTAPRWHCRTKQGLYLVLLTLSGARPLPREWSCFTSGLVSAAISVHHQIGKPPHWQASHPGQPNLLSLVWREMSTKGWRMAMPCSCRVKAGMTHFTCR